MSSPSRYSPAARRYGAGAAAATGTPGQSWRSASAPAHSVDIVDIIDIIDSVDSVGAGDGDEDCSRSRQNFKVIGHYSSGS